MPPLPNYITRKIEHQLTDKLTQDSKIIVLYGPRQVGKTTLVKHILQQLSFKSLGVTSDDIRHSQVLASRNLDTLASLVTGYELLFIDEAQRIPEIGVNLKLLHDHFPQLKIIVTGSSSLDLANKINEPLTGRTWTYTLYPLAHLELQKLMTPFELKNMLDSQLIYGSYPNALKLTNLTNKQQYLEQLTQSYLYKDIFELVEIRHKHKLRPLLQLLAFQVGSQVSLSELGRQLEMSNETVAHYIDLLEKSFVVFRLSGFGRNLRKEVTKMDKIYFYDNGVRNVLIDNLKPLTLRNDHGQLWENFLMAERKKYLEYSQILSSSYFWRTHTGAELDLVEESGGQLAGFEFKWSNRKKPTAPQSWLKTYDNSSYRVINQDNYLEFIT